MGGFVTFGIERFVPFAATGAPVISDATPLEGQTLSIDVTSIADRNGLGAFAYAWQSSADGVTWTNIAGATSATFAVPDAPLRGVTALAGQFLRVEVSFTDGRGDLETLVSASTGPVGINYDASEDAGVAGSATFTGLAGNDVLSGSRFADTLNGAAGNDTIDGLAGADTLSGGDGNDIITGGAGNDTIAGDAGDDLMIGGAGNDTISGGDGTDTAQYAGPVTNFILRTGGVGNLVLGTDNVGNEGVDTVQTHEFVRFAGVDYALVWDTSGNGNNAVNGLEGAAGNQLVLGLGGADTLRGGAGSDILVSGFGNDTVLGGDGDDFIFQNGDETGRDLIDGGAGTDYYIMGGVAAAETFRIYTRAAAEAAGMTGLNANTEIVITRNGTTNASIVAQLDNIEEIKINSLNTTANNGNNATAPDGGAANGGSVATATGDTVIVIGDFTQTSLDYSTITVTGTNANDTIDISGLTSAHRLVFESNGGLDTIIGDVRTQDVFNGDGLNDQRSFGSFDSLAGLTGQELDALRVEDDTADSSAMSLANEMALTTIDQSVEAHPLDVFGPVGVEAVDIQVSVALDHRYLQPSICEIMPA